MMTVIRLGLMIAALSFGTAATARQSGAPRNDLPQPYRTTRDWGQLPGGVTWAAVTAVEPAPDGTIYVVHRCFANSCAGARKRQSSNTAPRDNCWPASARGCSS